MLKTNYGHKNPETKFWIFKIECDDSVIFYQPKSIDGARVASPSFHLAGQTLPGCACTILRCFYFTQQL